MGITNFNKWLHSNYPNVFTKINRKEYDNVYIDLNPILHVGINKAKNKKDLIKRIIWLTDEVLRHVIPKKRIIFSTDGIPSFAKMILQRERRINMVKNLEIKNTDNFMNPIILTPGTDFMNELPSLLNEYFDKLKEKFSHLKIYELISIEHGESEFKLFNKMKDIIKENFNQSNILISNDADVIIMALSISNGSNNICVGTSGKVYEEINLNTLLTSLNNKSKHSHLDYTLLMLLMGNDYIPKLNYINLTKALPVYYSVCKKDQLVIKEGENYTVNNKLLGKIIFRLFGKNKNFKIKNLEELNFNKIENYLEGLIWCLNDYHNSKSSNMFFMYNYPKLGIPPNELYYFLSMRHNKIKYPQMKTEISIDKVNRKIYPAIVLPYKMKFLVKNNYCEHLFNHHKEYYEEELCKTCKEYHKKLSDLCITRKYIEDTEGDTEIIKKDIHKNNTELNAHKKESHKQLQYEKYIEIINELNGFLDK
jgi:5'-3' exonuclease